MGLFSSITDFFTGGSQGAANQSYQDAIDTMGSVNLPDIDAMKVNLEKYVEQGVITPEMANTILQEQTAMAGVSTDPRLKNAQMAALGSLQDVANQKGMTVADKAAVNQITSEENANERGQREAILQNAQQRGVGGSGLELASQLANQQGSATRASQRGFDVAANAQQRALEAMVQAGNMGGNIRNQDFSEQSAIAQAKDAISRFNAANQNTTQAANVAAKNQAQYANLTNKQNTANANVDLSNKQQVYNKSLAQQQFENEMAKKKAIAGIYTGQAGNYQTDANRTAGLAGGLLSGAANLLFPSSSVDFLTGKKKEVV